MLISGSFETAARHQADAPEVNLFRVVWSGGADGLASLLDQGMNINACDGEGMTLLHHAAASGARPCIRVLLERGQCDYLAKDNSGRYASELASEWARDYPLARLLRKKQREQADQLGVPAWEQSRQAEPRSKP